MFPKYHSEVSKCMALPIGSPAVARGRMGLAGSCLASSPGPPQMPSGWGGPTGMLLPPLQGLTIFAPQGAGLEFHPPRGRPMADPYLHQGSYHPLFSLILTAAEL